MYRKNLLKLDKQLQKHYLKNWGLTFHKSKSQRDIEAVNRLPIINPRRKRDEK